MIKPIVSDPDDIPSERMAELRFTYDPGAVLCHDGTSGSCRSLANLVQNNFARTADNMPHRNACDMKVCLLQIAVCFATMTLRLGSGCSGAASSAAEYVLRSD